MVLAALRHAEADVLQKYAAADIQNLLLDRKSSSDLAQLLTARQALSEESRQLVSTAIEQAQQQAQQQLHPHHQCTFESHSPRRTSQLTHDTFSTFYTCLLYTSDAADE